jgi:Predicted membrane protein (DUF2306)
MSKQAKIIYSIVFYGFAIPVFYFTFVMIGKVIPYLKFEYAYSFLGTKSDAVLHLSYYQVCFYTHITSSVIVIATGIFQFSTHLLKKFKPIHRFLGKIYLIMVVVLAAPSGMIIGLYANGGLSGKVGFVLQSMAWWLTTFWAWEAIMKKNYLLHIQMMMRSYALTLAAMSLRTESYAMYYFFETKPIETYQTVTWLSWVGNLMIVEGLIYYGVAKRLTMSLK